MGGGAQTFGHLERSCVSSEPDKIGAQKHFRIVGQEEGTSLKRKLLSSGE